MANRNAIMPHHKPRAPAWGREGEGKMGTKARSIKTVNDGSGWIVYDMYEPAPRQTLAFVSGKRGSWELLLVRSGVRSFHKTRDEALAAAAAS